MNVIQRLLALALVNHGAHGIKKHTNTSVRFFTPDGYFVVFVSGDGAVVFEYSDDSPIAPITSVTSRSKELEDWLNEGMMLYE